LGNKQEVFQIQSQEYVRLGDFVFHFGKFVVAEAKSSALGCAPQDSDFYYCVDCVVQTKDLSEIA
jgi:hypothetical protein